jgi:peptidoglycan-N-acetylglucosamine deacetylase
MPTWIFERALRPGYIFLPVKRAGVRAMFGMVLWLACLPLAQAEVITRLPGPEKVVALTFDGCEDSLKPAYLDHRIVSVLEQAGLPYTIFATGLFALRNKQALEPLVRSGFVEIENHSMTHPQHMERLDRDSVARQVADSDAIIAGITGHRPQFFRFPAGNYDSRTLAQVESMDHRVVHWRFPSGDPTRGLTPEHLTSWVLSKTRPGDILIFHINGRAPATAAALPAIIAGLQSRGLRFVRLDGVL